MNEQEIFVAALEQEANQRAAFLAGACGTSAELRDRIGNLLQCHEQAGKFFEKPAVEILATAQSLPKTEIIGTRIGPYKLLEQIGEGGMGVVYMAEQQQPVRRLVALKLVKPGMDSKQVVARFEAERQALAMMDHSNIAKVHDAGATETGRPYFVMELVRGIPINEFCDQQKLTVRQRLELFIQVCQAVQHAHQKGIIHRDLKPTNVLVTMHDVVAIPKIIDFGIAKALGQSLTDHTLHTGFAQLVGTPLYMSPEQAQMNQLGVDTRSDIFSLGVLLYELLTGTTPFDKEALSQAGLDEMRRMIREDEPPRPSARMSTLKAQALSTISQQRNIDPRRISATLRGELDWIVMKALEKDRNRRYESASSLAADIQRYLSDEPVLACPPTAMYRFQKFARKHKPAIATAAAIALCLLLGTTVSAWQAVRATTAEAQAQETANVATAQRDEVKALNEKLLATQAELRETLYAAHMNLARHAWEAGIVGQAEELLAEHRPKAGETDLRGFEWYYLYRLCHGEMLTLKGHSADVNSVAYSLDGTRLASGSRDSTVKVWDALTGRELLTLKGHTREVQSVAFSPDGKRLASGGGDGGSATNPGELKVWDAQSAKELFEIKGLSSGISGVAFSPDGKRLASSDWKGQVKTWDSQTGQELLSLQGLTVGAENVVFSPDGKQLAAADWNGILKVWDSETGQELLSKDAMGSPNFSPDGKRLSHGYAVMDAKTGKDVFSFDNLINARALIFSPNGKHLAGTSGDKIIRIYDAQSGQELFTLKGNQGRRAGVLAYSPDSQRLALASDHGTVKIWNATARSEARILTGLKGTFWGAAYSPDGKHLAITSQRLLKVINTQTGQELLSLPGAWGTEATFSPDGSRLAVGGKVLDSTTGQEVVTSNEPMARRERIIFSPDGKRVASGNKILDAQNGQELLALKFEADPGSIRAFSPDGNLVASITRPSNRRSEVKLWDAQTGQELRTLREPTGGVLAVAFTPDGKRLATTSYSGAVRIWDVQSGRELHNLKGHIAQVNSLAFSPDGKRLATHSLYNTVKVWNVETGRDLLTLTSGFGRGIAFSPDGHHLAGAGDRGAAKIWNATPLPEQP